MKNDIIPIPCCYICGKEMTKIGKDYYQCTNNNYYPGREYALWFEDTKSIWLAEIWINDQFISIYKNHISIFSVSVIDNIYYIDLNPPLIIEIVIDHLSMSYSEFVNKIKTIQLFA